MKKLTTKASLLLAAMGASFIPLQQAYACGDEPYLAGMCVFAGNFAPRGYALAQGQLLPINQNQSLYALLGTAFGGDGRTTFQLPDLRGRVAIGAGQGAGLQNYSLGQKGGNEVSFMSVAELPNHGHTTSTIVAADIDNDAINTNSSISLNGIASSAGSNAAAGNSLANINRRRSGYYTNAAPDVVMANEAVSIEVSIAEITATASTTIVSAGAGQGHENRMPFIAMNWIIATQGLFPSRN